MKIRIAGGTYIERCKFPEWNELFGSGLRAARAISALGGEVELFTYVSETDRLGLLARCTESEPSIAANPVLIPYTVSFDYIHGFSVPQISPPPHFLKKELKENLIVSGDAILRFGFIEGDAKVKGGRVVYDPQNPHSPELFSSNGSSAEELAIVCNSGEGRKMTGEENPEAIAKKLLKSTNCRVAVIKCGSQGAMVAFDSEVLTVPAFETGKVWPIGSGDVYAAVFAYEWASKKTPPNQAALLASKATAFFCDSRTLDFPKTFPADFTNRELPLATPGQKKMVYLAGPFFSMSQIWLINESLAALQSQRLNVFSPLHKVGRGPASDVYGPDIKGIEDSDVLFACVDGLDAGTLFEIGFAKARGKKVVAFVQNERAEDLKMLEGSKCVIEKDFVTAIYKTAWIANEP